MNQMTTGTTFAVSDVKPAAQPLPEKPYLEAVMSFLGQRVEACSRYHGRLVSGAVSHPLIAALHAAYVDHRPLCLSPDMIWLTICQGVANHINANAEQLRSQFVAHTGRVKIVVRRDDFVKGSPENPWPEAFGEFSAAIRDHIGDEAHSRIVSDFSTTGPVERAAAEVVLLDAMQSYFDYEFVTRCGIPSITLEGTADDWRKLAARAERFRDLGLAWWVSALAPVLAEFEAAAAGRVNCPFWESIYKWQGPAGSGSPYVTGWALTLFPYLYGARAMEGPAGQYRYEEGYYRNPWLGGRSRGGPGRDAFPRLPARAPFVWDYLGQQFEMEFIGGLVGVGQDAEGRLRPEVGWAVRDTAAGPVSDPFDDDEGPWNCH